MKIAVDAMGGDNAPLEIVKGCVEAAELLDGEIILTGRVKELGRILLSICEGNPPMNISIVNATEVIENEDHPVRAARTKKDSSMVLAVNLVRDGKADAALSAGNTGALMASGLLQLGRIPGIDRPAIISALPVIGEEMRLMALVDAGANAECRAKNLLDFAYMGSVYIQSFGVLNPKVGLVNIGVEETKGTAVLKEAYGLLSKSPLNFIGNVEARDIPRGIADVLVCDGFTGNIVLKLTEGVCQALLKNIKGKFTEGLFSKAGSLLLSGKLRELKEEFNYETYGSAPILGLRGLIFKMHGSSSAKGVANAVLNAAKAVSGGVAAKIEAAAGSFEK